MFFLFCFAQNKEKRLKRNIRLTLKTNRKVKLYYYYLIELQMGSYSVAVVLQYDTAHRNTRHTK
jgi:hypothetical protein